MTESPTPPPPPEPVNYSSAGPELQSAPDKDSQTMGMLCHLLGIFTGFLGPLIIWLIKKDSSPYVDQEGKEALNFQIVCLIATFACFLGFCLAPFLIAAVQIFRLVFSIIASVQSSKGHGYRYPVTFRLIK
jgi:uncharacterized protein